MLPPLPSPPPYLTPNTVTPVRVASWTRDLGAGRQPVYAPAGPTLACAVQPSSSEDVPDHLRESQVTYYTVKFYADPSLKVRDQLVYLGLTLVVTGVRPSSGGAGRTWVVLAEHRAGGGN